MSNQYNIKLQRVLSRTEEAVLGYVVVDVLNVTAWLEIPSVGVKVIMCHSLLDAHAESHALVSKSVDGIHKFCIVRRQSVRGGHAFKERARRVETWIGTTCNREPVCYKKQQQQQQHKMTFCL